MSRRLLTPKEIAAKYGISVELLAKWRCAGKGPAYTRIGGRIRYPEDSTDEWAMAGLSNTSKKSAA